MERSSEPLVSFVTPMYNEAQYLPECIESVLAQTYRNWNYTIVDNCSTDGSAEIALEYAAKDARIRVHRNERFLPVIANHNAALRLISSESKYCKVVLGDDWIFPNCVEQMVAVAEANPTIGIVGAYALEGDRVAWTGLPFPGTCVSGREICRRHLLEDLYVFGTPNAVLYRADLVRKHDPFYNEENIHADTEVCFQLLKTSDFGFVHQVLTVTRVRSGSLNTRSREMATSMASMLQLITVHAPHYLTRDEQTQRFKRHLAEYYRFLGKSLMLGRKRQFWDYHKAALTTDGLGFSYARLARGAVAVLCDAALNPKDTVDKFLEGKRRRNLDTLQTRSRACATVSLLPSDSRSQAPCITMPQGKE